MAAFGFFVFGAGHDRVVGVDDECAGTGRQGWRGTVRGGETTWRGVERASRDHARSVERMADDPDENQVRRFVGVYNANGSVGGELGYFIGARLGRAHCALCDITHGLVRERATWKEYRRRISVSFDAYHRDDQPAEVRAAHGDRVPVVLAVADDGLVVLLDADELSACAGSVEVFSHAIDAAVTRAGLSMPS